MVYKHILIYIGRINYFIFNVQKISSFLRATL